MPALAARGIVTHLNDACQPDTLCFSLRRIELELLAKNRMQMVGMGLHTACIKDQQVVLSSARSIALISSLHAVYLFSYSKWP